MAFPLAPMDGIIRTLTCLVFPLPLVFLALALRPSCPPLGWLGWAVFGFLILIWLSVWLFWRPTEFRLSPEGLRLVWPVRQRAIPAAALAGAELLTCQEFRARYGRGMRVGAGGLWGGFGLLVTPRQTFSMYISRLDPLVVVQVRGGRPLLLTPESPGRFVEEINRLRVDKAAA
ncbi:MAG: hypothetical protein HY926_08010 [Elusimicrobia bacterium]|nr:hypothetical protein [Elusimicrobiota bacterium]